MLTSSSQAAHGFLAEQLAQQQKPPGPWKIELWSSSNFYACDDRTELTTFWTRQSCCHDYREHSTGIDYSPWCDDDIGKPNLPQNSWDKPISQVALSASYDIFPCGTTHHIKPSISCPKPELNSRSQAPLYHTYKWFPTIWGTLASRLFLYMDRPANRYGFSPARY